MGGAARAQAPSGRWPQASAAANTCNLQLAWLLDVSASARRFDSHATALCVAAVQRLLEGLPPDDVPLATAGRAGAGRSIVPQTLFVGSSHRHHSHHRSLVQ
jgi:hypothetical protein